MSGDHLVTEDQKIVNSTNEVEKVTILKCLHLIIMSTDMSKILYDRNIIHFEVRAQPLKLNMTIDLNQLIVQKHNTIESIFFYFILFTSKCIKIMND